MPFPESNRVVYELNPLAEVICQLQFPTVLRIASELPSDFQQRIRESYPVFRQETGMLAMPAEISQLMANLPGALQGSPVYLFESESGGRTVTLSRDALAVTERSYSRWENLRDEISAARDALEAIYAPAFYTRIGLRYQDVLDPHQLGLEDVPWVELLHPAIAGVLGAEDEIRNAVSGLVAASEIRITDMQGATVRVQYGLVQTTDGAPSQFALDADFYTSERTALDRVPDILDRFNRMAGNLFRWAIKERLRDALRPTPVES